MEYHGILASTIWGWTFFFNQQFLNFHQGRILSDSTDSRPVTCIAVVIPRHSQPVTWNSKFDVGNNTLTNFNSWFHNGNHNGNHELFHHDFHLISWRDFWESFGSLIFRWGDIQSAVRLVFPGELSRHAVSEGCKVPLGKEWCEGPIWKISIEFKCCV
jgi:hypothetical protein